MSTMIADRFSLILEAIKKKLKKDKKIRDLMTKFTDGPARHPHTC